MEKAARMREPQLNAGLPPAPRRKGRAFVSSLSMEVVCRCLHIFLPWEIAGR